jgi:DNA polymerase-3 subunit gamma/tau
MYRPMKFSEVHGQELAIRLLKNGLIAQKLPRTLIFYGPSGVGKTTLARLVAAWFVCTNKTDDLCGVCNMCIGIQKDSIPDIIELDAASNTGIDDIRQILDQCNYAPQFASEKIFIIDEAHMLSRNAIASLLKTFEETANHIRFILATTEIDKISEAIRSRCFCIPIQQIKYSDIHKALEKKAIIDKVEISKESVDLISMASNGSMREANTIFEQVAMLGNGVISVNEVEATLAFAPKEIVSKIANFICSGDYANVYDTFLDFIHKKSADPISFLIQVLSFLKEMVEAESDLIKKQKLLKIIIDINKLKHESLRLSIPLDMVHIGLCEVALNAS